MSDPLVAARTFMLANARILERQLFHYHFETGSSEAVTAALRAYQNPDGGFGNALEPDKRTPSSQPIDQEFALLVMDDIGLNSKLTNDLCTFLSSITTAEAGVPFSLPSVSDAPHAPWWGTTEVNPPASLNPTASLAGLLYKHSVTHDWLTGATAFCWRELDRLERLEMHLIKAVLYFLAYAPDRDRALTIFEKLREGILEHTALDPQAEGYVASPLSYAPSPDSLARQLFDDTTINAHLDATLARQQPDGGWPIAWQCVSPSCEWEYRGIVTYQTLKTLRAYGRL